VSAALPFIRRILVATAAIGLTATSAFGQLPDFTGRPIVDLVNALRDQGIRIVYSDDLLPTRLIVLAQPSTDDSFSGLREILSPHGLDVVTGPSDTWLIVRQNTEAGSLLAGDPTVATPALTRPSLETVIVTASRYSIDRPSAISANAIGRHTLETTPALGQDPLRVTQRLPGVSGNQLSSRMHVRGGKLDEVLLRIDGVRLYDPYHLKDFQNIFSSINPRIIESLDVRTGGFEAKFGDRMSGVIDMQSIAPTELRRYELGLSLLETSILSSGLFDNGRGAWVTALRRGNLDFLSDAADSDIGTPQYVDFFNKLQYTLSSRWKIGTGLLSLDDKITLNDGEIATATADYDDAYFWLTLDQNTESGLEGAYRIAITGINRTRAGTIQDPNRVTGSLAEHSQFDRRVLSADWAYPLSDTRRIIWGIELAESSHNHSFRSDRNDLAPITIADIGAPSAPPSSALIRLDQSQGAFYSSYRLQPIRRLVAEFGIRWDRQSLIDASQLSPRINMLFDITRRTSVRAAWGEFDQSQPLNEIAIADGITTLQQAEESEHFVIGLEQQLGDTVTFRFEAYTKSVARLNTRFENLFERADLIPELLPDRFAISPMNATIRGAEISGEGERGAYSWWSNLARSRTEERLASGKYRRSWDELLSMKAGGEWSGAFWTVTATAIYRSGWPIGTLRLASDELIADNYNSLRLPDFSSVDVRASRRVSTRRGELNWYMEISNLFDHSNFCCLEYDYSPANGIEPASLSTATGDLLGIVPNFGLRLQL
jgi:hypothetical protein